VVDRVALLGKALLEVDPVGERSTTLSVSPTLAILLGTSREERSACLESGTAIGLGALRERPDRRSVPTPKITAVALPLTTTSSVRLPGQRWSRETKEWTGGKG
jgi:hypothetical protein